MKGSLVSSSILHTLVLGWALISIGAPESFDVADVEALPVDIVPIEELTQIQQGDKKAPLAETSAPTPTKRPDSVPDAQNAGENTVDTKSVPVPNARPSQNEAAAAPEKVEKVQPTQDNETNDIENIIKEETVAEPPPKPVEVAKAEPPKPDVTPEPTPPEPAEATPQEAVLPDNVPVPAARPKPPAPKPAEKKPEEAKPSESKADNARDSKDKKKDAKTQETAKSKSTKESDFNADEIAALLNKTEPSAGGAKKSTETAALGGQKTTTGSKLSMSEMDALRGQIANNWSVIPGLADVADVRIRVRFQLDESGRLVGDPEVSATGGTPQSQQVLMSGARRAVLKSAPFSNLPRDKYDAWSEVVVNFDPSDLAL